MRLVLPTTQDESQEFADWLARQHGSAAWHRNGAFYAYGLKDGDEIRAAIIIEPFHSERSYLLSTAMNTPDVMKHRELLKHVFSVPFSKAFDANRISLIIEDTYTRVIRVAEILGFVVEGNLPNHFGENSGVLLGMTKDPLGLAG